MDPGQRQHQPTSIDISSYEQKQRQSTLNIILVIVIVGSLTFGAINFFIYEASTPALALIAIALLCIPTIWLNVRGHYLVVGFVTTALVFVAAFFNLIDGAGIRDPAVVAYPIIVLIGGLLFGKRALPAFTVIGILSLVLVVVVESTFSQDGPRLIVVSALLIAGAGATHTVLNNTLHNINRLKESEENLRQALEISRKHTQRIDSIIETVPEGVLLLNTSYQIILANQNATLYLKTLAPDYSSEGTLDRIGPYSLKELIESTSDGWHEIFMEEPEQIFEAAVRPVEKVPSPYENWVVVLRDVTLEHKQEASIQEQIRLATVGQLASGMAHDFRNILSVISTYSQIAQIRAGQSKDGKYLTIIQDQVKDAALLIDQILDFGRQTVMQRQSLDAVSLVKNTVSLLKRTLPSNITITFTHNPNAYILDGDKSRLQQVLMNLAVNARDAMPNGGSLGFSIVNEAPPGELLVESEAEETADWLCLKVQDSGGGIPAEVVSHIFEPFFTTKAPGKGTGLGLAQVYGIVKQHGGEIAVETAVGEGTTFSLYFPRIPESLPSPADLSINQITIGREITVLLVEDNPLTRQSTEEMLQVLGCQVLIAENGRQALNLFNTRQGNIDLVISDIIMPEMGGLALYQALKEMTPLIKMLIMSGYPLNEQTQDLLHQDHVDWIQKPYQADDLAEKIANLID